MRMPRDRWSSIWPNLRLRPPPDAVFADLRARYAEPHRAYHTLRHIEECFEHFDALAPACERPTEVALAIWFHDAFYDPHAADNEARSADLAISVLTGTGATPDALDRVRGLILTTKHDAEPRTDDERVIADIDLAILGAARDRFDEYEAQIRQECAWVPEPLFRRTRAAILRGFLSRSSVYRTPIIRARLEAQARTNLGRSLARLAD